MLKFLDLTAGGIHLQQVPKLKTQASLPDFYPCYPFLVEHDAENIRIPSKDATRKLNLCLQTAKSTLKPLRHRADVVL